MAGSANRSLWNFFRDRKIDYLVPTGLSATMGVSLKILQKDSLGKVLLATGTTKPTDATTGFAKGCLFIDTDVATGSQGMYVNVGTSTSCVFAPVTANLYGYQGYNNPVRTAIVDLTNANIKALRASGKELVASPGSGYYVEFISASLFLDYGSNVLTESTDNLAIRYSTTGGIIASQTIEATGFIDASADTYTTALPKVDVIAAKAALENLSLILHNTGDGEYAGNAGADTVMQVRTNYRVWAALD